MSENTNQGPTKAETVLGGKFMEVKLTNGQSQRVHVKQLPMRMMVELASVMGDPVSIICLCTGNKAEWTDSVDIESFEELVRECDRVNMDFLGRWAALQKSRLKALKPLNEAVKGLGQEQT